MNSPIAIIAGVGSGTGASVARKFATAYPVILLARSPSNFEPLVKEINGRGGQAVGISADVTDEGSIQEAFGKIEKEVEGRKCAAAVFNVGGGLVRKPFLELSREEFEGGWRSNG